MFISSSLQYCRTLSPGGGGGWWCWYWYSESKVVRVAVWGASICSFTKENMEFLSNEATFECRALMVSPELWKEEIIYF